MANLEERQREVERNVDKIQSKVDFITDFIKKFSDIHTTIETMKDQVTGSKEFRENFDKNVKGVVTDVLKDTDNLKRIQEITREQIKIYVNNNTFEKNQKEFTLEIIHNEINKPKSPISSSLDYKIDQNIKNKENVLFKKLLPKLLLIITGAGSIVYGLGFAIYQYIQTFKG